MDGLDLLHVTGLDIIKFSALEFQVTPSNNLEICI
jgi:hypothetical protein